MIPAEPNVLMDFPYKAPDPLRGYEPLPDGRFAVIKGQDQARAMAQRKAQYPDRIHVVQNWFAELEERVPTANTDR